LRLLRLLGWLRWRCRLLLLLLLTARVLSLGDRRRGLKPSRLIHGRLERIWHERLVAELWRSVQRRRDHIDWIRLRAGSLTRSLLIRPHVVVRSIHTSFGEIRQSRPVGVLQLSADAGVAEDLDSTGERKLGWFLTAAFPFGDDLEQVIP